MGLDNGIVVKSNKRPITRADLPNLHFPFTSDYSDTEVEIAYARKCWGLRSDLINSIDWDEVSSNGCYFRIYNPDLVYDVINVVAGWLDEDRWDDDGDSIWNFDQAKHNLINWIVNLSCMILIMEKNPDIYLEFYDSY